MEREDFSDLWIKPRYPDGRIGKPVIDDENVLTQFGEEGANVLHLYLQNKNKIKVFGEREDLVKKAAQAQIDFQSKFSVDPETIFLSTENPNIRIRDINI